MSDISPITQPQSPRGDPDEPRRFQEAMDAPLKILAAMRKGQTLQLTDLHRFDLAKVCVQENVKETVKKINLFVLPQAERVEIAKLCAQKNLFSFLENIKKFDLTSEQILEIAKSQYKILALIDNVEEMNLTKEHRFELAKFCLQMDAEATVKDIENFDLTNEQLFELAKLCIEKNISVFVENIVKFNFAIQGDEQRFEIAKLCFVKSGSIALNHLDAFKISDEQLIEILPLSFEENPAILGDVAQKLGEKVIPYCIAILSKTKWLSNDEWEMLTRKIRPEMRVQLLVRASNILSYWSNASEEERQWLSEKRSLFHILASRAADLDSSLISLSKKAASDPSHFEKLAKTYPPLLSLPLAQLKSEDVNIDTLQLNPKDLNEPKKILLFIDTMIQLAMNNDLSDEEKTKAITAMTYNIVEHSRAIDKLNSEISVLTRKLGSMKKGEGASEKKDLANKRADLRKLIVKTGPLQSQTLKIARDLWTILTCRSELLEGDGAKKPDDLRAFAGEALESVLPLPEPVDNFLGAYERTFGSYRQPNALQIYAARLSKEPEYMEVLKALGAHVLSVFRGTYTQERYDPATNPHLKTLEDYDPNLLRDWQKNSQESLELFPGLSIHETDDPEDILLCGTEVPDSCQKVDGEPLLNQGLVGYLRNGQTRLLAIKDKEGHIVARRLIRLLWDDRAERPVLFLEPLYSNNKSISDLDKALIKKAEQIAQRLHCPLTSQKLPEGQYKDYPHPISSLGGLAPCEYADGAGGLRKGPYTIHLVQTLFTPPNVKVQAAGPPPLPPQPKVPQMTVPDEDDFFNE